MSTRVQMTGLLSKRIKSNPKLDLSLSLERIDACKTGIQWQPLYSVQVT